MSSDGLKDEFRLGGEWELELPPHYTEEDLLRFLRLRIAQMLDRQPDYLFSLMYRLDISERDLRTALASEDQAAAMAAFVWKRQQQKMQARRDSGSQDAADPALSW